MCPGVVGESQHVCNGCQYAITFKVVGFQRFIDGCNAEYPKVIRHTCKDYTPMRINAAKRPLDDLIQKAIQNETK